MRCVSATVSVGQQLGLLEHDADALAERAAAVLGIEAEHRGLAAVALSIALEDLDGGRLAGAVRAEQAEDLAARDLEADPPERLVAVVGLAQTADRDRAGHIWQRDYDDLRDMSSLARPPASSSACCASGPHTATT